VKQLTIIFTVFIVLALVKTPAIGSTHAEQLLGVRIDQHPNAINIELIGDSAITNYNAFSLDNPSRIVLDLKNLAYSSQNKIIIVKSKALDRIRIGCHPQKVRVVLDIADEGKGIPPYTIKKDQGKLIICMKNTFSIGEMEDKSIPSQKTRMNPLSQELTAYSFEPAFVAARPNSYSWLLKRNSIELGIRIFQINYKETEGMKETGPMLAISSDYTHHSDTNVMFNLNFEYAFGELDYDGNTQGGTPLKGKTDDYIAHLRALVGHDIITGSGYITPFIGVGIRYWNNNIKTTESYEREIGYLYCPIGINLASSSGSSKWVWGLNIEYDLFIGGRVNSRMSDIGPGYRDIVNRQKFGSGHGARLSCFLETGGDYPFTFEPFLRYWHVNDSQSDGIYIEPKNETTIAGFNVSIRL